MANYLMVKNNGLNKKPTSLDLYFIQNSKLFFVKLLKERNYAGNFR